MLLIQILAMRSPLYLVTLISLLSIQLVRSSIGEPEQRSVVATNPEGAGVASSVDETSMPSQTTGNGYSELSTSTTATKPTEQTTSMPSQTTGNSYSELSTSTTATKPTEQTTSKPNSAMKQTTMNMFIVLTISLFVR